VFSNTAANVCGKGYETAQIILLVLLCDVADTSTASGVHTHSHAHTHIHTHIHAHTHIHTHAHAHIHTHTHTYTHTHTHTHTHTYQYPLWKFSGLLAQLCGEKFMPGFIITEIISNHELRWGGGRNASM